jgi:pimeloyl-ACP methyl ester carboxylesterase
MSGFTLALGLSRYTLYMQDYGGPVGFRMALAHPERLRGLVVQDAVALNRVAARDRRGHGRSEQTWTGNDYDTFADDLAQLLEKLDLKEVTHVGHCSCLRGASTAAGTLEMTTKAVTNHSVQYNAKGLVRTHID